MFIVLQESFSARFAVIVATEYLPFKATARVPGTGDLGVGISEELPGGPLVDGGDGGAHGPEPAIDSAGVEDDESGR